MASIDEVLGSIDLLSAEQVAELKSALPVQDESVPVSSNEEKSVTKIKCKVCGFHKKPKKGLVETGICKPCTDALGESKDGGIEVVGRMGKRGRNTVSVVIDGQRFRVRRMSSKHSERVAAKHASKPKGFAKKSKRSSESPKGIRTDSRIGGDREQRTHEQGSLFA